MIDDPMDRPPVDHGSDRYDYVELIGAPAGVAPHGAWFDKLLAGACLDCNANVFLRWAPEKSPPWEVTIAHDEGCPTYRSVGEVPDHDGPDRAPS